jgi:glycogen debranching enzyme
MNFVPLVLGARLPENVRTRLVEGLKEEGRFLCSFGLTTESLRSPFHEPDGYWSGPVWGPAVTLVVDGLVRCGENEFARDIAQRYCDNMVRNGTAENFNSLTGAGQNDRAYTWSTSAFLLLSAFLHSGKW